jgi:DNA-binding response OmpR family regulator
MKKKYVYLFTEGNGSMRELLGGKGANLAEMTNLGMPVPQGFTITTEACTQYYNDGEIINDEIKYLAERENKVFSREQLLEEVWGYEYYGDIRTVDVTVRRLREKLEDDSSNPKYIMTKRGIGYYFRRP